MKIQGQGHGQNSPGPLFLQNTKEVWNVFKSYLVNSSLQPVATPAVLEPEQKHNVTPGKLGWINHATGYRSGVEDKELVW